MSSYPPPPTPGQPPYHSLYQENPFASLDQHLYTKAGSSAQSQAQDHDHQALPQESDHDIQQALAHGLQHHAALDDQHHQDDQIAAHLHQHDDPALHMLGVQPAEHQGFPESALKANRLRKACDSCSIRKVKCDESGPPCRACAALDIPCTFDRPSRRRGPPNRHAEAMKRRKIENAGNDPSPGLRGTPPPSSPNHATQPTVTSSLISSIPLTAESICSLDLLELLIDDFFVYVHPIHPFPHEPSFREAWKRREDMTNASFLALLCSMLGCLVASFPRKPRLFLRSQERLMDFPDHTSLIKRCQKVCLEARGPTYLISENLNVHDAATSFFLGHIGIYTSDWHMGRLYLAQCVDILQALGLHRGKRRGLDMPSHFSALHGMPVTGIPERPMDNITLEMSRRVFWATFVSVRSLEQQGVQCDELAIPPPTSSRPYPDFPTEVDDLCIYPSHNDTQPPDFFFPVTAGFNADVKIYISSIPVSKLDRAIECDLSPGWEQQKRIIFQAWRSCKNFYEDELGSTWHVIPGMEMDTSGNQYFSSVPQPHLPRDPAQFLTNPSLQIRSGETSNQRREIMLTLQKANIYISYLATRIYLTEKFWMLFEAFGRTRPPGPLSESEQVFEESVAASNYDDEEREMSQVQDDNATIVLALLGRIDQVNLEPNGDSYTTKLRRIAAGLIDIPDQRKGKVALVAQDPLRTLLQLLLRLERVRTRNNIHLVLTNGANSVDQQSHGFLDFGVTAASTITGLSNGTDDINENIETEAQVWAELRATQELLIKLAGGESGANGVA